MTGWRRALFAFACGRCASIISKGEPQFLIQPDGLSRAKERCQHCAGEPVPVNLDEQPLPTLKAEPLKMMRLGSVPLPFDWKERQSGELDEREPGAEG